MSHSFPLLTETFVYREVVALQRQGFRVETFAIWKPHKSRLPEEARHLVDTSHYVFPISWSKFFKAHLRVLGTSPWRYLKTLAFVLTRRGESLSNRRRTFFHFCEAVYLAPEMTELNIRHVHAQFAINAATIALVCSRLLGITFSFTAHNSFFHDRVILREKAREARFIVAISQFTREFLIRLIGGHDTEGKIHVVHCGLSPYDFAPPDQKPANEVPVLLFVGQLTERKGASVLVEACRILAERDVAFLCVVVGDGPQRALLEQL
ncbi:MAG: glycosyltransferase, partial [Anaerolineae bacterium]|nr:glycosyltransferase [Anaerolineae bacterium]